MNRHRKIKRFFKDYVNQISPMMIELLEDELQKSTENRKRIWTRKWILRRGTHGASVGLLRELASEDVNEYRSFMRMNVEQFQLILQNISDKIQRSDTAMREAISAKDKLQVTLSFLATGNSFRTLQHIFRVPKPSISAFLPEVLDAIYDFLKDYIKVPETYEEWGVLENGFRTRWNFPGCYGAIDGKHVSIQAPNQCGSEFWNYKGSNSIVLMAIVDHDYCFRYINVGANGRNSDGGIFRNCSIYQKLENNNVLPDGGFFVGDDAFPLKTYLLKPYSHRSLAYDEKIFNYRLSRARRIVENAFGILASRFRIFHKPISTRLEVTDKIIRTACALHNWLRMTSGITYLGSGTVDVEDENTGEISEGTWRRDFSMPSIVNTGSNHSARQARELRETYKHYFTHEGAVPWQDRMIY